MKKFSDTDRINIYYDRKEGMSLASISSKYNINTAKIQYWVRLADKHGTEILRAKESTVYPIYVKHELINRVLNGESIKSVSVDVGLSDYSLLCKWVKKYKEMGYNIVERKRGQPTMSKKTINNKSKETIEEKIHRLEEENLYLKAELEYSKKLRVVVQARKNQQQKKK